MQSEFSLFIEDLQNISIQLGARAEKFRNTSVFLTGCTGFVGRWLMESLLWCNQQAKLQLRVQVLTRSRRAFLTALPHLNGRSDLDVLEGDILTLQTLPVADFDYAVLAVNHRNSYTPDWAAHHCAVPVLGAEELFRMAGTCGCHSVLVLSSGAVYGVPALCPDTSVFREEAPSLTKKLQEPTLYGESKRFLELFAVALGQRYGIRVPVARCFTFCGAHLELNGSNALASFMADLLCGRDIQVYGDGRPVRSYMYGSDMAVWLLTVLTEGEHGVPYNIGSQHAVNILELAQICSRLTSPCTGVNVHGGSTRSNAPTCYVPDTTKIRADLQVQEWVTLEEGLRTTLHWFLSRTHNVCTRLA